MQITDKISGFGIPLLRGVAEGRGGFFASEGRGGFQTDSRSGFQMDSRGNEILFQCLLPILTSVPRQGSQRHPLLLSFIIIENQIFLEQ